MRMLLSGDFSSRVRRLKALPTNHDGKVLSLADRQELLACRTDPIDQLLSMRRELLGLGQHSARIRSGQALDDPVDGLLKLPPSLEVIVQYAYAERLKSIDDILPKNPKGLRSVSGDEDGLPVRKKM